MRRAIASDLFADRRRLCFVLWESCGNYAVKRSRVTHAHSLQNYWQNSAAPKVTSSV